MIQNTKKKQNLAYSIQLHQLTESSTSADLNVKCIKLPLTAIVPAISKIRTANDHKHCIYDKYQHINRRQIEICADFDYGLIDKHTTNWLSGTNFVTDFSLLSFVIQLDGRIFRKTDEHKIFN